MKFAAIFLAVIISSTLCLLFVSSLDLQIAYASPYRDIDVGTAHNMITSGNYPNLAVLDVRTQGEYDNEHLEKAVLIPQVELEARIDEFVSHKDHEIIVYCKSGGRSQSASEFLEEHGFAKVYNMLGGIQEWKSASYPVWTSTEINFVTPFWMQWLLWTIVGAVIVALVGAVYFFKKKTPPTSTAPPIPKKRHCTLKT